MCIEDNSCDADILLPTPEITDCSDNVSITAQIKLGNITYDTLRVYELAKEISSLRQKGILIIGSGNMVHNLRMVAWKKLNEEYAFDWATEANEMMKSHILSGDHQKLIDSLLLTGISTF